MMKKIVLIMALLVFPLYCFAQDIEKKAAISQQQVSETQTKESSGIENEIQQEIELITKTLNLTDLNPDLSGFNIITEEQFKDEIAKSTIHIVSSPIISDVYSYSVIYNKENRMFWITKSGGFAGEYIIYGPAYLDKTGKIVKKMAPASPVPK